MSDFERRPPHDIGAEQVVLGAMMMAADTIAEVSGVVSADDHYRPAHQVIHQVICDLDGHGDPAGPVAVAAELARRGDIGRVGGAPYLHTLIASVPTVANAGYYARIVREHAVKRRLIEVGTRIVQLGYSGDDDADELTERARQELDGVPGSRAEPGRSFDQMLTDAILGLEGEAPPSVPLPWVGLDHALSVRPGSFTVIGARPGAGKSVVLASMAAHVAIRLGRPAVIFSLEMSADELMLRLLASEARIPLDHLIRHQMDEQDWDRLARVGKWIGQAPLTIHDEPGASVAYARSKIRGMRGKAAPAFVGIDYLQLMTGAANPESRQQDVAALSRGCKLIAREFNVPVVAAAQLNRSPERREGKRPQLSDLRDSGQIEADADNVLLLHREDAYERESPRAGEIDLIIAKQRMGPMATVTLAFQGHYARCADMAKPEWSPSSALREDSA